MKFLAALSSSDGESLDVQIRDWIASDVIHDAEQYCLGQNVTAADGRTVVDMIKQYQNMDHLKNGG
jgi:hypothetical protein